MRRALVFVPINNFLYYLKDKPDLQLHYAYNYNGPDIIVNQLQDDILVDYIDFDALLMKKYRNSYYLDRSITSILDSIIKSVNSQNYDYILCSVPMLLADASPTIVLLSHMMTRFNSPHKILGGIGFFNESFYRNEMDISAYVDNNELLASLRTPLINNFNGMSHPTPNSDIFSLNPEEWNLINTPNENHRYELITPPLSIDLLNIVDIQHSYNEILGVEEDGYIQAASISFSQLCPNNCHYCYGNSIDNSYIKQTRYKRLTLLEMQKSLMSYVTRGYNSFIFTDRLCNGLPDEFYQWMIDESLNIKWSGSFSFQNNDPDYWYMIHEAGCCFIDVGVESVNDDTLKFINKKITVDDIEKNLTWAHDANLLVAGNFMIDLIGEHAIHIKNTIEFIIENYDKFFAIVLSPFYLVENSKFYIDAADYGIIPHKNPHRMDYYVPYTDFRFNKIDDMISYKNDLTRDIATILRGFGIDVSYLNYVSFVKIFALSNILKDNNLIKKWYMDNLLPYVKRYDILTDQKFNLTKR